MKKRGQAATEMPFGIIFAVFLIVLFIIIAFNAVKNFMEVGDCSSVGMFYDELQKEVDLVWSSQSAEKEFKINLPTGIKKICFADLSGKISNNGADYDSISLYSTEEANTFLVPTEKACSMPFKNIKHLNITQISSKKNPYCVDVNQDLKLKKGFYDKSVLIE
jgi:hypothetical protein